MGWGLMADNLITTDIINRDFSTPTGRYNPDLPDIAYRANQGFSDYNALAAVVRYRPSRGMVQAILYLEPQHRQSKRSAARRFFQSGFYQHPDHRRIERPRGVFRAVQSAGGSRQLGFRSAA